MVFCGARFSFALGERSYLMGILNVTPDSFSDGGAYADAQSAVTRALEMERQGADLIDVGACSTAPNVPLANEATELRRLQSVLPALVRESGVPVSVDTFRPAVAAYALTQGAAIVNDVSGVFSPEMATLVRAHEAGWILTHAPEAPDETTDIVVQVNAFFDAMLRQAAAAGLRKEQLCLDVGIGFGKSRTQDMELLRRMREIDTQGAALLCGASRKRVIGVMTGESDPKQRLGGSVAAHMAAAVGGADFVRAHDVKETAQALRVAAALFDQQERRRLP